MQWIRNKNIVYCFQDPWMVEPSFHQYGRCVLVSGLFRRAKMSAIISKKNKVITHMLSSDQHYQVYR